MTTNIPIINDLIRTLTQDNEKVPEFHMDNQFVDSVLEIEVKKQSQDAAWQSALQNKVLRDVSPEAQRGRRRMLYRAVYGEFMATLLLFCPIFLVLVNGYRNNWSPEIITLTGAFVPGFQVIGLSYAFSSISGAVLNPAVALALWSTGKLSNRRCVYFILAEMLASFVAMVVVSLMYSGELGGAYNFVSIAPQEGDNLGKVFATEFFLTFFLTYTAFTVAFEDAEAQKQDNMSIKTISDTKGLTLYATTPQSKTGFAPFSIGFVVFCVSMAGGTGGSALNPARMFGPALFSGKCMYTCINSFTYLYICCTCIAIHDIFPFYFCLTVCLSVSVSFQASGIISISTGWARSPALSPRPCWSTTCTRSG